MATHKQSKARLLWLDVATPQGTCGTLGNEQGSFVFAYRPDVLPSQAVSLLMPPRLRPYTGGMPPPIFSMNLPEGYVLEQIRLRLAKLVRVDPMLLLAITGDSHPIGRLTLTAPALADLLPSRGRDLPHGESLAEILAWDGADDLFEILVDRYILRSGISGVQPKVVVPERASARTAELIVKGGRDAFPGLAINEFVCMSMAKAAGLAVPQFWLSDNHKIFVMRRFDVTDAGDRLGFEDFAALTGRQPEAKYEGSYEMIAKAIAYFASDQHRMASAQQLFDTVALSCIVGNGDAHLKNFGMLYTHPAAVDARLAPVYDVVNTTAYLPRDVLALKLQGSKAFAGWARLERFASACWVDDPQVRITTILGAVKSMLEQHRTLLDEAPIVGSAMARSVERFDIGTA